MDRHCLAPGGRAHGPECVLLSPEFVRDLHGFDEIGRVFRKHLHPQLLITEAAYEAADDGRFHGRVTGCHSLVRGAFKKFPAQP